MTERKSDERRRSDEDEPKVEKETVEDLEPAEGDRDVRGGVRTTVTEEANGCNS